MSERKPAKPRMRIRPSVVISMTTHPGRDGTLGPTIASLLAQSYPIAEIRVYCTAQCAPLPAGVTRVTVAHDLGPLTKLSAVCDGRVARKALVVTVDDDNVYDAELVERLVADAERYPDEVICALGWDYDTAQQGSRKFVYLAPGAPVAILGGSGGVLYRKSFFGPDVLQAPAAFFPVDDFWISAYLRRRNIGIRQADVKWRNKWCPLHQEDANRPGLHTRPDFMDLCTNAYLLGFSRDPMPRIIISLTTHPGRNGTLQPTIDSLLAQTRAPDEIRLYHGAGCRDLPSGCRCIEVADIGPLTKLTAVTDPSLRPDDLVITVDDDQRYQETWLARLLELAAAFPDDAVGFSGWNADELLRGGSYVFHKKSGACDVLEGWAGAAYRPRFFGPASSKRRWRSRTSMMYGFPGSCRRAASTASAWASSSTPTTTVVRACTMRPTSSKRTAQLRRWRSGRANRCCRSVSCRCTPVAASWRACSNTCTSSRASTTSRS